MAIDQFVNLLAAVTLIEMMVTLGLRVRTADVFAVVKQWNLLGRALLANYIIVPGAAVGLLLLFHASSMVAAGFLVAAVCPGAPYAPPFTSIARGNVTLAVGLMVALAATSAIVAPLLLGFLLPIIAGHTALHIDMVKMIGTLVGAQLFPLCFGLWVRQNYPEFAEKLKRPAGVVSLSLNILLLTIIIGAQFQTLAEIHLKGYFGMFCLALATLFAGRIVAGREENATTKSMILTTSVRNVGVSLVIATGSFPGTAAITSATAYGIVQTILIALVALAWGRLTRDVADFERKAA